MDRLLLNVEIQYIIAVFKCHEVASKFMYIPIWVPGYALGSLVQS